MQKWRQIYDIIQNSYFIQTVILILQVLYSIHPGKWRIFTGRKNGGKKRQATIVYSGGDDVFIVGAWNDIIELSVDLRRKFEQYTQGTLSISAGIGVYDFSYPIAAIAEETGRMESESKRMPEKMQ